MGATMRVGVVGAGVLGASLAHHLRLRGAQVTLVDAVGPGSGTSSRGAGLLGEGGWHETSIRLVGRSLQLLQAFSDECARLAIPFKLSVTGSTTLVPEGLVASARALAKLQSVAGADVREVAPEDVPDLPRHAGVDASDVAAAFHYPRDAWALPRMYTEVLTMGLDEAGARVLRGAARLTARGDRVALHVDGAPLDVDAVVAAAGVRTRALLQGAGVDAPLLAYRTQALRVTHPRAHEVPILHDAVQGCYLRPSFPGQLVVGDGTTTRPEDPDAWVATGDAAFVASSLARLRRRFPFLAHARAEEAWAGLDAATPDRLLLAGPHPHLDGLWLLAGGNGHGFMRAPATGEGLAAMMLGERPPVDLAAYDPSRFAGRMSADFVIREGYSLSDAPEVAPRGGER